MKKYKILNFITIVLGFLFFTGCNNIKNSSNYNADKTISNNKVLRDTVFSLVASAENSTLN